MEKYISSEDQIRQNECREEIKKYVAYLCTELKRKPIAQVITYGCQQNEADSQIIAGELESYGYRILLGEDNSIIPELIVFNTCAVREHAELKALSKLGNLKAKKEKNPYLITGVGGCMVQQEHRLNKVKNSYPYVDFIFGTNALPHFPEILFDAIKFKKRVFHIEENDGYLPENMPVYRPFSNKAYVSVMYGCNNFCTYCVVPYVKGRERSRQPEAIIDEITKLVSNGCKEITLLGQNVNSYGKDLTPSIKFFELCNMICRISGDFTVTFLTSHPKDVSDELIKCIAENKKMAHRIHFPLQSGSNSILKAMNRRYTVEEYIQKVNNIRHYIPDAALSSDFIVGFPGETEQDFEDTLTALKTIRYDFIFSFIYSRRVGTPAAEYENQIPEKIKNERLKRLLELQTDIMADINNNLVGQVLAAHIDGISKKNADMISAHTDSGKIIHIPFDSSLKNGDIVKIKITKALSYQMYGELVSKGETI